MKRSVIIAAVLATLGSATLSVAGPAHADSYTPTGNVCAGVNASFTGNNRIHYTEVSGMWQLTKTTFEFAPAVAGSDKNNQNLTFFGGSSTWSINSADDLLRDAQWHDGIAIESAGHVVKGQIGSSWAQFDDIFDVAGTSDPSCQGQTPDF